MTATTTTAAIPTQAQPVAENSNEHGSRLITALEGAWAAIQAQHPEVPHVLMITGTGRKANSMTWGHFGEKRWTVETESGTKTGRTHELFAGGELLSLGGLRTMQTLLHEAAHALAHVRKIKDTSSDYRYHNKRFVKLAEELGLAGPATPENVNGWNQCTITDAAAQRYTEAIAALDAARLPYVYDPVALMLGKGTRPTTGGDDDGSDDDTTEGGTGGEGGEGGDDDPKPKKRPTRFLVICGCIEKDEDGTPKLDKAGKPKPGRAIQVSRKSWEFGTVEGGDEGGLMCGRCKQPFRKADPDA
ncbi:hypothetical protein [Streptomyces sp. NBC_01750]|uniref:hypothetical protein n=1 Tax=Streptomyces sp. NBC_01750 TaxID=2975928 RepID=UPI002DD93B61|nr:hypothetical protein [Streptomyces sp. NBC_01750]WSD38170.1 SprT-like domain-containing protein [Streptomyces sp. NBC_01750]